MPKKILGIGIRQIGDLLMATPSLRLLHQRHPAAQIDFIVDSKAGRVMEGNPDVSRLLILPEDSDWSGMAAFYLKLRRERYDWVVDFMGGPRSAMLTRATGAPVRVGRTHKGKRWAYTHTIAEPPPQPYSALIKLSLLAAIGVDTHGASIRPVMGVSAQDREWAAKALPFLEAPVIAVAPASKAAHKTWPADSFARAMEQVAAQRDVRFVFLFGPGEEGAAKAVREAAGCGERILPDPPRSTLAQTAALMERCALYLGNDSGLRHMAVAVGLPTIGIFGRINPVDWTPPGDPRHSAHCMADRCFLFCLKRKCPVPTACIGWVEPGEVAAAAIRLLG